MKNTIKTLIVTGLVAIAAGCNKPTIKTERYAYDVPVSSNCIAHVVNYDSDLNKIHLDARRTVTITKTLENEQVTAYLDSIVTEGKDHWSLTRIDGKDKKAIMSYLNEDSLRAIVNMNGEYPNYAFQSF